MASLSHSLSLCFPMLFITIFFTPFSATISVNADQALIDKVCSLAVPEDYNFCRDTLRDDPRSPTANLDGLCLLSVALTIDKVRSTSEKISGLLNQEKDPLNKQRLSDCEANYSRALSDFYTAYKFSAAKAYRDVINSVRDGTNEGIACENSYKKEPRRPCPVSTENMDLIKYSEITFCATTLLLQ